MADYIEIVTDDVDALVAFYEASHGLKFGSPDADLGHARVAERADGSLIGIRKPLASHETPIMRTYIGVDDISLVTKKAVEAGGVLAYGPTGQGKRGTFSIVFAGGVQHGFWQR